MNKVEIDVVTGIETLIPMTEEEILEQEERMALFGQAELERIAAEEAKEALKESAKSKLIAGQPLTAEEADTLII